jgi:hypothetical protein
MRTNEKIVTSTVLSIVIGFGMVVAVTTAFRDIVDTRDAHNRYSVTLTQLDRDADRAYSQCVIPKLEKRYEELEEAVRSDNAQALLRLTAFPEIDCLNPYREAKQKVAEWKRYKEYHLNEIKDGL